MLNGTFERTIVLRNENDTVVNIKHDKVICIDRNDVKEFFKLYDSIKDEYNVVLDLRLSPLIWYFIVYHGHDILIYDSNKGKILTLYSYLPQYFFISSFELPLKKIQIFFKIKIILSYYFDHLNICWNTHKTVEELKKYTQHNHRIFIDTLLNIIGIKEKSEIKQKNINKIINLLCTAFSDEFRYNKDVIIDDRINKLNINVNNKTISIKDKFDDNVDDKNKSDVSVKSDDNTDDKHISVKSDKNKSDDSTDDKHISVESDGNTDDKNKSDDIDVDTDDVKSDVESDVESEDKNKSDESDDEITSENRFEILCNEYELYYSLLLLRDLNFLF